MAKKKAKPQPVDELLEEIKEIQKPVEIHEREAQDEAIPDDQTKPTTDVWSGLLDKPVASEPVTYSPSSSPPIEASSVDEYIRKQVIKEMYGTETPTQYDIIQQALKRRL